MKKIIARIALFLGRYKLVNRPPDEPVMLLIAAPHTSNWDFMLMLFMAWASDLSPRWLGKREMFDGMLGPVFKGLDDLVAEARTTSSLALVVPVEGTREKGDYWKSGFYRIASEADIPIVPSFLDGPTRTGGYGPTVIPSGDLSADMDKFRAFYADKRGVKPKNKTTPRLREEDSAIA